MNCSKYLLAAAAVIFTHGSAAEPPSHREQLKKEVQRFVDQVPVELAAGLRADPDAVLTQYSSNPGFMQVTNSLELKSIPEWGIHNREVLAQLVIALATAQIKGQPFDLLGHLRTNIPPLRLTINFPLAYNLDKLKQGYEITRLHFVASMDGDIQAQYVATREDSRDMFVNQLGQEWRKATAAERSYILSSHGAARIGVPIGLEYEGDDR